MKTEWDYTNLAEAYLKRADYSESALDLVFKHTKVDGNANICDIGAGVAHLTIPLAERGFKVTSVEPNDEMRKFGKIRTENFANVTWFEGTGEETGQIADSYEMVTFGSSFNVTDRVKAVKEAYRILKSNGWFVAMWNHRDLNEEIQSNIESIVKKNIPDYDYGTRRQDQTAVIEETGLLRNVVKFEGSVLHKQDITDVIEAWRSHATLERQAKEKFPLIVKEIEYYLKSLGLDSIDVPYTTRIWVAQRKD